MDIKITFGNNQKAILIKSLVLESFKSKFSQSGFTNSEIISLSELFWKIPDKKESNCQYVVIQNKQLAGTMLLKRDNYPEESMKHYVLLFFKHNPFKIFKLLATLSVLEHQVKKNEIYIDYIVIDQHFRNLGIGSKLLNKAMTSIKEDQYLSLYVAKSNIGAIELYKKKGFKIVTTKNSYLRKIFLNEEGWHYMTWSPRN
ncbi:MULTISPECIES: N-acetyltransferase [Vagococcus]|uniref:Acetyltransferase, GNAT family n=1 Tax=Vagococcus fluvialis bH819 TaxID=1255619 RepID=A0A1X6WT28_9ENTE|nr:MULTISPECIES: N-acetyltransferase [Vagococcus]SLM86776.1 acetyltransferase, GNAT family [Vagococcus fluvialis bH819]HCM88764.1 N-acetyltransferase [Vagococcus sp.]